jgi:antirestriction protein ArdC
MEAQMAKKREYSAEEKAEFKQKMQQKVQDFTKDVCRKIVDTIASGATEKWERPWDVVASGMPQNPVSGHRFSGGNALALMAYMMHEGESDPRFCTFKQAKMLKGDDGEPAHVKKGAKAITIMRPIRFKAEPEEGEQEEDAVERVMFRPATVFHASQIENMPTLKISEPLKDRDWSSNEFVESLVKSSGVPVTHGFPKAAYFPGRDVIRMPDKNAFKSGDEYYATLLHEWMHSTGAPNRENRFEGITKSFSGIKEYAREELCAETFSAMASMAFGVAYKMSTGAEYINYWNKRINEDPKEIFTQAVHATKMLGLAMDFAQGQQPEAKWFPNKSSWVEPGEDAAEDFEKIMGLSDNEAQGFDDDDPFAELDDLDFGESENTEQQSVGAADDYDPDKDESEEYYSGPSALR